MHGLDCSGRYMVLGFGSLIWDLEILTPHVKLPWHMSRGPALPMEFSRVSPKRLMGLAVVLDPENGSDCLTHAVASGRDDVHAVAEDLRRRERASDIKFIGAVCVRTDFVRAHHSRISETVRRWCGDVNAAGAVWTDLPGNFSEHTGNPFSLGAARTYLQTLRGDSLREAVRYIDNAPVETDTPLRRMLAADPWWAELPRDPPNGAEST
jgi:hypothetical protein